MRECMHATHISSLSSSWPCAQSVAAALGAVHMGLDFCVCVCVRKKREFRHQAELATTRGDRSVQKPFIFRQQTCLLHFMCVLSICVYVASARAVPSANCVCNSFPGAETDAGDF